MRYVLVKTFSKVRRGMKLCEYVGVELSCIPLIKLIPTTEKKSRAAVNVKNSLGDLRG